ncbi:hypothetical protein IE077_002493 [Cardiosporidium cionae]|uniref:Uncharacterized protein n=1 Tax=Cardiosporidium cionae TaxID=476202 RepID=A0ABQ7J4E6_9APIC|nr:hypothetical protein IE077_002493 [Cardiosporidium cionae]|eukprot:KAF8817965.1 hypothetical protein IE077_002493 [Cardiosporidium cionae]
MSRKCFFLQIFFVVWWMLTGHFVAECENFPRHVKTGGMLQLSKNDFPHEDAAFSVSDYSELVEAELYEAEKKASGKTPVIRVRWHESEEYLKEISSMRLRESPQLASFFIVLGDGINRTEPLNRIQIFHTHFPEKLAPLNWESESPFPFEIPTSTQLLDRCFEDVTPNQLRKMQWCPISLKLTRNRIAGPKTITSFDSLLQKHLPSNPLISPDGDGGTPVLRTNSDGQKLKYSIKQLKFASSTADNVNGNLPMDQAFIDHDLVRIPTAEDLRKFAQAELDADGKKFSSSSLLPTMTITYNQFEHLDTRFNYSVAHSMKEYTEKLVMQLKHNPINLYQKGTSRKYSMAVIIISVSPEEKTELLKLPLLWNRYIEIICFVAVLTIFVSGCSLCHFFSQLKR